MLQFACIRNALSGVAPYWRFLAVREQAQMSEWTIDSTDAPNVVVLADFREKRPEWVFECKCGSQLFFLHRDGTVECRSCKLIRETIEWVYRPGCEP
jgi:hypothetical protein